MDNVAHSPGEVERGAAVVQAARDLVRAINEREEPARWYAPFGNIPGHCHQNPPRWDVERWGICDWCVKWQALLNALGEVK